MHSLDPTPSAKARGVSERGWGPASIGRSRGRPDFAEAGGKQPEKIDEMLEASRTVIEKLLGHS